MKKLLSIVFSTILITSTCACVLAAPMYNITPKAPQVSANMKPIIAKYRQEDYIGAMQDLEDLVKIEKNNTYAKYYLALCYTRLGYREEAQTLYKEVIYKDDNMALSHYSKRALSCLDDPNNEMCLPPKQKLSEEEAAELDDITLFINSGKKIHPAAMDKITRERMKIKIEQDERKRAAEEEKRRAMEENQLQSYNSQPTNEEIASALNTLSKIGMNPYNQQNAMLQAMQYNQYGMLNNNMFNPMLNNNMSPEIAKMFLYNQMSQQQGLMNYGI